jgi:rod shape-determining protein MreC
VPRNRTARLAVLASVAQRAAPTPFSSRASSALRRRAVAAALVLVSLALITVYFREADGGRLHGVQGAASTVLQPFQIGATKIASPFRDAYGYFADLVHAKSRVDALERQNAVLRQQRTRLAVALQENDRLRQISKYKATPRFPDGYKLVAAEVTAQPPSQFDQTLTIAAGANDGVRANDAVVDPEGNLVGKVSLAYSRTALVTLLTDEASAVAAKDPTTGARGLIKHAQGADNTMILDRVEKKERVRERDNIITSGFKWRDLSSLYPKGIPIGWVSSTSLVDTANFRTVKVTPYADLANLDSVVVVTSPEETRGLP